MREYMMYQCEECGKKYEHSQDAIDCEKKCRCEHKNTEYQWGSRTGRKRAYGNTIINNICVDCSHILDTTYFSDITKGELIRFLKEQTSQKLLKSLVLFIDEEVEPDDEEEDDEY